MTEALPPLVLVRSAPDRTLHKAFLEKTPWDIVTQVTGDDVELGTAIPTIFRMLAAPEAPAVFPRAPKPGDPLWASLQYWYPLIHMLRFSLGWARPDKGLWWWYQENKPRTDPRLRVLADVYDRDGHLDGFCAWLWKGQGGVPSPFGFEELGWHDSGDRVAADPQWIEDQLRRVRESGLPGTSEGGWDPLHLSGHCHVPLGGRQGGFFHLHTDETQRRAVRQHDRLVSRAQ